MIIGSNAAENHPMSFKWVMRAKEKGAKVIHVDPRYTRTSSRVDIYAPLRSGTDIAFIGGLISYVITNKKYHEEYVREYTNATFLIDPAFGFQDGVFSGFEGGKYNRDKAGWKYQNDANGNPKQDMSMTDPNCVFQLLKKQYHTYTPEMVEATCGMPKKTFRQVAECYSASGAPGKSGTIMYAMGTTQHTYGSQNVRSYAILQLLLGNVGVAGGGINALRGESNVQGSTDYGCLYDVLTGYLKTPRASNTTLQGYLDKWTPKTIGGDASANWLQNTPKYTVSLLKAFWGDYATKDNEFAYQFLPKIDDATNYSHIALFEAMDDGKIKGLILMGQNPAVGGPNALKERRALEKLDWMVACDLWLTDTMEFWHRPEVDPKKIKTEVFVLPMASSVEKEGSISNSGRWMQWRYKAAESPGVAQSDLWFLDKLYKRVAELYAAGGTFPDPIVNLMWHYGHDEEPDVHLVAKECNGYAMADTGQYKKGQQIASFAQLMDDGTTCCGSWIYCGSYTEKGNMAARRNKLDAANNIGLYPEWAWSWPVNRRIIYNRASCNSKGEPYAANRWVIKWDPAANDGKGGWLGDVPDGGFAPGAKYPFIMLPEGRARLFGTGLVDGPFPVHYEPVESPIQNPLHKQQNDPVIKMWASEMDAFGTPDKYPIVATTYRVVEHWQAGQMTRNLTWLSELMPDMFIELSHELAAEKGIKNGDRARVITARGSVSGYALVTHRFTPFRCNGKTVHQIGLPWHWGYSGIAIGESANILTPHVGDANTMIPEYKAFLCDIEREEV